MFNIKEELAHLDTGFWCCACLSVRPFKERSEDPRHCQTCWQIIKTEERLRQKPTEWTRMPRIGARASKKADEGGNPSPSTKKRQKRRIKRGDNVNKKVARQGYARSK